MSRAAVVLGIMVQLYTNTLSSASSVSSLQTWLPVGNHSDPSVFGSETVVELMPYVGNGFVATHPITGSKGGVRGAYYGNTVYMAGVFNGAQFSQNRSHRAALPGWVTSVTETADPGSEHFSLDVKRGLLTKTWTAVHASVAIKEVHYAHRVYESCLVHSIQLENRANVPMTVPIKQSSGTPCGGPYGCDVLLSKIPIPLNSTAGVLLNGSVLESESSSVPRTVIAQANTVVPSTIDLKPMTSKILLIISAHSNSMESKKINSTAYEMALANHRYASSVGAQGLLNDHVQAWSYLWESGIDIEGDVNLARAINGSMYYILSSARYDAVFGLSPGGLASGGYHGHTFWDQETWMWPFLNMFNQKMAKQALQYRFDRQAGAATLANHFGFPGLRFPWESAQTGIETETSKGALAVCSVFEIHISGDICFAFYQYWQATMDKDWLLETGLPVIRGIATFFAARVDLNDDGATYGIHNVTGPDEYHAAINNSRYVNTVAALSIRTAIELSSVGQLKVPKNWSTIAKNLRVNSDHMTKIHPEYDGYKNGTIVKQADVILLGYPIGMWANSFTDLPNLAFNESTRLADLDYYATVTDPDGPAMTWAMFAMGYLEAANSEKAESFFRRGYANVQEPFQVWTETPSGGCVNFITGAGGFLQSVIYGYGGIRLHAEEMRISPPKPPASVDSLSIRGINFRGWTLTVRSLRHEFLLVCVRPAPTSLFVLLPNGSRIALNCSGPSIACPRPDILRLSSNKELEFSPV